MASRILSALVAGALALSPTVASAQMAPSPERVTGSQLDDDGSGAWLWIGVSAIVIAVLLWQLDVFEGDYDDDPVSP